MTVCRLPQFTPFIPKGRARNRLKDQCRFQNVELTRAMSPANVREAISRAFPDILTQWVYLEAGQDNHLAEMGQQSPDGNTACSRRGCLYIMHGQAGKMLILCSESKPNCIVY